MGYNFCRLCQHPTKMPVVSILFEAVKGSLLCTVWRRWRIPYPQAGGFSLRSAPTVEALMQQMGKAPVNHIFLPGQAERCAGSRTAAVGRAFIFSCVRRAATAGVDKVLWPHRALVGNRSHQWERSKILPHISTLLCAPHSARTMPRRPRWKPLCIISVDGCLQSLL